jgi:hypothetical protein
VYANSRDQEACRDNLFKNIVVWTDRGHSIGVTCGSVSDVYNITFRNCDVIHSFGAEDFYDIPLAAYTNDDHVMRDILFDNIRVEGARFNLIELGVALNFWSVTTEAGNVRNVTFRNCSFTGAGMIPSKIYGYDSTHKVSDITFENLKIGGLLIRSKEQGRFISTDGLEENIKFIAKDEDDFENGEYESTELNLVVPEAVKGSTVNVSATLTCGGVPVAGKSIEFKVNNVVAGTAVTSAAGVAELAYKVSLRAGTYEVRASFTRDDNEMLSASQAIGSLTVNRRSNGNQPIPTPTPTPTPISNSKPVVEVTAAVNGTSAKAKVDANLLSKAFKEAEADESGVKTVQ